MILFKAVTFDCTNLVLCSIWNPNYTVNLNTCHSWLHFWGESEINGWVCGAPPWVIWRTGILSAIQRLSGREHSDKTLEFGPVWWQAAFRTATLAE